MIRIMEFRNSTAIPRIDVYEKTPGHWVLASLGKKVLRPGGLELTRWMLRGLSIQAHDYVVELAPGTGRTAQEVFRANPANYIGIDANAAAIEQLRSNYSAPSRSFELGKAEATGLADSSASVLFGEASLTMQSDTMKRRIVTEAHRVLQGGGRYGIHELCILSEDTDAGHEIRKELSRVIRVNANPLAASDWAGLLRHAGFEIKHERIRKMELLKVTRLVQDEGALGTLRIAVNAARHPSALLRVLEMREVFDRYSGHLGAISIVAEKP